MVIAHIYLLSLLGSLQSHLTATLWALGHTLTSCSFPIDHYWWTELIKLISLGMIRCVSEHKLRLTQWSYEKPVSAAFVFVDQEKEEVLGDAEY